ncbi:hypothetical protein X742_20500 [Mesorhizobium sp. LNHC232B00]|nr:hypothetical protein X742_20500 [Mesorhizobium sp. LNHC232B00]
MTQLRQRMSEDMQVRNFALNTQLSYLQQVSLFARYFSKSPDLLGREDIRTYQIYLTNEKKLAPGSIHIAIAALRFLYKVTLEGTGRLKRSCRFPRSRRSCRSSSVPRRFSGSSVASSTSNTTPS